MKRLSIITINYNNAVGLQRTIDSIVNQTFTDYEWIVVDGGSTDGSKEILAKYKDHFAWWCSEPDKGVYNAMNKGIAHASGEYVNFMNSGDIFATPTILDEVFSQSHDADILIGVMAHGSIDGWQQNIPSIPPCLRWWELYKQGIGHQSEFVKRDLFKQRMFDESFRIAADWDWNAYFIAAKRAKTEFIPLIISVYEDGGISAKQKNIVANEKDIIQQRYFASLTEDDIIELKYVDVVKQYKVSRILHILLSRLSNRLLRYKKRDAIL